MNQTYLAQSLTNNNKQTRSSMNSNTQTVSEMNHTHSASGTVVYIDKKTSYSRAQYVQKSDQK